MPNWKYILDNLKSIGMWFLLSVVGALYASMLVSLVSLVTIGYNPQPQNLFFPILVILFMIYLLMYLFPGEQESDVLHDLSDHLALCITCGKTESDLVRNFSRYEKPEELWYDVKNTRASVAYNLPLLVWTTMIGLTLTFMGILLAVLALINLESFIRSADILVLTALVVIMIIGLYWIASSWRKLWKIYRLHKTWKEFWHRYWHTVRARLLPISMVLEAVDASFWDSLINSDEWLIPTDSGIQKNFDILRDAGQTAIEDLELQDTIPPDDDQLEEYIDRLATYHWLRDFYDENGEEINKIQELNSIVNELTTNPNLAQTETLVMWYINLTSYKLLKIAPEVFTDLDELESLEESKKENLFEYANGRIQYFESLAGFPWPPSVKVVGSIASIISLIVSLWVIFWSVLN